MKCPYEADRRGKREISRTRNDMTVCGDRSKQRINSSDNIKGKKTMKIDPARVSKEEMNPMPWDKSVKTHSNKDPRKSIAWESISRKVEAPDPPEEHQFFDEDNLKSNTYVTSPVKPKTVHRARHGSCHDLKKETATSNQRTSYNSTADNQIQPVTTSLQLEKPKTCQALLALNQFNPTFQPDEDYHFLVSLLQSVRRVPSSRKSFLKMRILQILCEEENFLAMTSMQQNSPSNTYLDMSLNDSYSPNYFKDLLNYSHCPPPTS